MLANKKVKTSRDALSAIPAETIAAMCDFLVEELGKPTSSLECKSLESLQQGDYDSSKRYCLADPCNSYLAALSCIASAYRSPMVADSVLRDASRHVSEVAKLRAAKRISEQFQKILKYAAT